MTYKERIQREEDNKDRLYAYSDGGLFFNLYDRSAFVFYTRVKPFKVHVKTLKGLVEPYITIGFPISKKEEYITPLGHLSEDSDERNLNFLLSEPIDEENYNAWRRKILMDDLIAKNKCRDKSNEHILFSQTGDGCSEMSTVPSTSQSESSNQILTDFAKEVLGLNIAAMTPMEALLFINDMQKKLREAKNKGLWQMT